MNIKTSFSLLILSLVVASIVTVKPSLAVQTGEPTASGNGEFNFFNQLRNRVDIIDFSFDSMLMKNGKTRGRALFDNLTTQTSVDVKLNCMAISAADAVMSGTVQRSTDPDFPFGANVIFAVTDGDNVPIPGFGDRITPLTLTPSADFDCNDGAPSTVRLLDSGQIVVRL